MRHGSAQVGDADFGKIFPCPVCVLKERDKYDWFGNLMVTDANRAAIAACSSFARNPDGWLVLVGAVGTGKTTLAKAIVSHWAGHERLPQTVSQMFDRWRSHVSLDDLEEVFHADCDVSVAVLDDMGAERVTDWTAERLTQYLDWRYIRRQPTVITTNCDRGLLADRFRNQNTGAGERIADRVFDEQTGLVQLFSLTGASWRAGSPKLTPKPLDKS